MPNSKPPLKGYALWFEAVQQDQEFLQELIDVIANDYETRDFGAHATLLGLADKTEADLSSMRDVCKRLAGVYNRIEVELVGVGVRNMHFQSVFLMMVPSLELFDLNGQARCAFGHGSDPPYMQHWSAMYGDVDRQEKNYAVKYLICEMEFPRLITVNNIALVDVEGYPNEWNVIERFPLCG